MQSLIFVLLHDVSLTYTPRYVDDIFGDQFIKGKPAVPTMDTLLGKKFGKYTQLSLVSMDTGLLKVAR